MTDETPGSLVGLTKENLQRHQEKAMTWVSPVFKEIFLCCEINSYVSAQL